MESFVNTYPYHKKERDSGWFAMDNKGRDWYETQKLFLPHTLKVVTKTLTDVRIACKDFDVSKIAPTQGECVYEVLVENCPEEFLNDEYYDMNAWIFRGDKIVRAIKWNPYG